MTEPQLPLVSVIMATYQEPIGLIDEAISSILAQSYSRIELIIVCDAPTRGKEVESLIASKNDERVRFACNTENIGLGFSLNRCVELAKGSIIARMDADDISLNERISRQVETLLTLDQHSVLFCPVIMEDSSGEQFPRKLPKNANFKEHFFLNDPFLHPTMMCYTAVLRKHPYRISTPPEDWDLYFRLYKEGYSFVVSDKPEFIYRFQMKRNFMSVDELRKRSLVGSTRLLGLLNRYLLSLVTCRGFAARYLRCVVTIALASNTFTYNVGSWYVNRRRANRGR